MLSSRTISLLFALSILLILSLILLFQQPLPISSPSNFSSLKENQKVSLSGQVVSEYLSQKEKTLSLDNKIKIKCSCPAFPTLKNRNLSVMGIVERYNNETYVRALKIEMN